jgi:hypothetical protein
MTALSIWNQALGAANARGQLSSIDENSPEADVCRQWYSQVVRVVQSAAWWPGCRAFSRLGLASVNTGGDWTDTQPEPGFQFAYTLPSDLLRPWHLSDFSRFNLAVLGGKTVLSTNTPQAILVYGLEQTDVTQWSALQVEATIYALAAKITPQLTGRLNLVRTNYELANRAMSEARAAAHTDIGDEQKKAVPWLAARSYAPPATARFLYPYGELFSYAQ